MPVAQYPAAIPVRHNLPTHAMLSYMSNLKTSQRHKLTNFKDFNVTGAATLYEGTDFDFIPGFSAYCSTYKEGDPFQECDMLGYGSSKRHVNARLLPYSSTDSSVEGIATLAISYQFQDPE
jgi:hypothetical protein